MSGELSRRGVSVTRAILLTSAGGLLFFIVSLIWYFVGHEDSPPPAGFIYFVGMLYGALTLFLAYWLLSLAGDPSVSQRGTELQAYGIKSSPDLIIQLDNAMRVVALNPTAERHFKYSGHAVRGMPLSFLIDNTPAPAKRADVVFEDTAAAKTPALTEESAQSRARELALRAGTRLTALAQPLFGYTELALQGLAPDHPVRGDIAEIGRSASRVVLLAQTLELYGANDGLGDGRPVESRAVDLGDLLDELRPDFEMLLAPGTRIKIERPADPVVVQADPRLTRLATLLLAANAEESMPPESTIAVTASPEGAVRVSDTGPGLTESMRSALFTPLSSTKDPERGLGLGLIAARAAMHRQQAELLVARSNASGTVVSLVFPPTRSAGGDGSMEPREEQLAKTGEPAPRELEISL